MVDFDDGDAAFHLWDVCSRRNADAERSRKIGTAQDADFLQPVQAIDIVLPGRCLRIMSFSRSVPCRNLGKRSTSSYWGQTAAISCVNKFNIISIINQSFYKKLSLLGIVSARLPMKFARNLNDPLDVPELPHPDCYTASPSYLVYHCL